MTDRETLDDHPLRTCGSSKHLLQNHQMQIPGNGDDSKIVMHELIANNISTKEYYIAIEEMIPTCK